MSYWNRATGGMTKAEMYAWDWCEKMGKDDELCTLQRYADTKEGQAEKFKAWFATVEEAEYYLSKGRAYERPTSYVSR